MSQVETPEGQAVYKQIEQRLRSKINRGEWRGGAMLPSRRELAKHYGVSPLTIGRAVSGLIAGGMLRADDRRGTFVTDGTSADAVSVPKVHAGELRSESSDRLTIGIIGSLYSLRRDHLALNNEIVRSLVHSLESAACCDGNRSYFFNRVKGPSETIQPLNDTIEEAFETGVGAIAVICRSGYTDEIYKAQNWLNSRAERLPIVFISSGRPLDRPAANVFYDNFAAGYDAAGHLLAAGCKRIKVFAPTTAVWATDRIAGARAAVMNSDSTGANLRVLPEDPTPWVQEEEPTELAYRRAKEVFNRSDFPDGIICLQDQGAFGVIQAAEELGLTPGRDYALIGFDDHPESRTIRLSTMRAPIEAMGREAARLLLLAAAGQPANHQINLRWNLIARASTNMIKEAFGVVEGGYQNEKDR